ncbi:hypothetical protein [Xanthomarina sp. GH4-25]|uniref:hypothetical protein n=1 Tax=Xanthomarina sp. GH4-25 TaxID=3349335 RepID=UPI003877BC15
MKRKLTLLTLLISLATYAQQSINYKALIKDDFGSVVVNDLIQIQFSILEGEAQTNVYQETHTPTTDVNGLIIVNIGEGTTSDDFSSINWSADDHFLNVQIDTGTGLTDLGTTQFMAVPYALSAANVTGLEALDEGNGIGWRLKGRDLSLFGSIGNQAVDLSYSHSPSTTNGASGFASLASGLETEASGSYSIAMGNNTLATRDNSTAFGAYNVENANTIFAVGNGSPGFDVPERKNALTLNAGLGNAVDFIIGNHQINDDPTTENDDIKFFFSGQYGAFRAGKVSIETGDEWNSDNIGFYSAAFGSGTIAYGGQSFAAGNNTNALGYASTALGSGTVASTTSSMAVGAYNIDDAEAQFMVGNGVNDISRNSAFVVEKNGTITAPSFDLSEITDDKALITKEYADVNLRSSGLEQITENGNDGWRLTARNPVYYGTIGDDAVDLSISGASSAENGATGKRSFATGFVTKALGESSTVMGAYSEAHAKYSTAIGSSNVANGERSTALGFASVATGFASIAIGNNTETLGSSSIAMGNNTLASGITSTAMGASTVAQGENSTATGKETIAVGDNSFAVGNNTVASRDNSFALGAWNSEDASAILMVGNGTQTNSNTAFKVMDTGDAIFDGELNHTSTGTANMMPIAYGTIESNANVLSGTGNFSATISSGVITITVDNENLTVFNSACTIVPYGGNPRFSTLTYLNNKLEVRVFNSSDTITPTTFQFVLYKL